MELQISDLLEKSLERKYETIIFNTSRALILKLMLLSIKNLYGN